MMGLSLLGDTIQGGLLKAPVPSQAVKDQYHFRHLLGRFSRHVAQDEKLTKQEEERLRNLGGDCAKFLNINAHACYSYTQLLSTLTDLIKRCGMPQVGS